ncbi:MAG: chemotaxis protein CheX [Bryobacteraceae bacterium]
MLDERFSLAVEESLTGVLETMFFTSVLGDFTGETAPDKITATLSFNGEPSGSFWLAVSRPLAREMAANFLGCDDEIEEQQSEEVVRELANMVCGSVLSRVENHSRFDLSEPVVVQEAPSATLHRVFEVENGTVEIGLNTQP